MPRLKKFSFLDELSSFEKRDERITELCNKLKSVIDLDVLPDFNYKAGKFIGLVKLMSRSFKKRAELAKAFGISERVFTLFNEAFGTPTYLSKEGKIVSEVPMDIPRVLEILSYLEEKWEIPAIPNEYSDFNEERIAQVYASAKTYANDQLLVLQDTIDQYDE